MSAVKSSRFLFIFFYSGYLNSFWATRIWRMSARRATSDFEIFRALLRMWSKLSHLNHFLATWDWIKKDSKVNTEIQELVMWFKFFYDYECIASIRPVCLWSVCVCFCPMRSWMKTMWSGQPSLHVSRVIQSGNLELNKCALLWCVFFSLLCVFDSQSSPQTVSTDRHKTALYERVVAVQ